MARLVLEDTQYLGDLRVGVSATPGHVLTADADGVGTWQASAGGSPFPLDNDEYITARNAADSADKNLLKLNASDYLQLGTRLVHDDVSNGGFLDTSSLFAARRSLVNPTGTTNTTYSSLLSVRGTVGINDRGNNFYAWATDGSSVNAIAISAITQAAAAQVTATAHGYVAGDKIAIYGAAGMTGANGAWTVQSVVDANNFTINYDSSAAPAYTGSGTVTNRGMFYGYMSVLAPSVDRGLLTGTAEYADDVANFVAFNNGPGMATDAYYLGRNSSVFPGTALEYGTSMTLSANSIYGIRLNGYYSQYAIDLSVGTPAVGAIRLRNASHIRARNAADSADLSVIGLQANNLVQIGAGHVYANTSGNLAISDAAASAASRLHIISAANNHIQLQRTSAGYAYDSYISASRHWVFNKPTGAQASSLNAQFQFWTIGGVDSISPFWSGFAWYGHTVTESAANVFPNLTMFSRSTTATDPTDYEFMFSAGNASARPLGVSFASNNVANAFVRFGFGNSGLTVTGLRLEYNGSAALIGFLGATPVVRPSSTTDIRQALIDLGLYTTGGASPLDLNGGTLTAAKANIAAAGYISLTGIAGNPASPVAGDFWYNTTQKSHRSQSTIGTLGNVGLAKTQTSIQAGDTNSNSAGDNNYATNFQFPANSLTVGKTIRVTASGTYGTHSSGTVTINLKIKLGTVVLMSTGVLTTATSLSGKGWWLQGTFTVISVGASGTVEAQGFAHVALASTTGSLTKDMVNTAVITIDTTAAQTLQIGVQHGATNANNTSTMRQLIVEVLD